MGIIVRFIVRFMVITFSFLNQFLITAALLLLHRLLERGEVGFANRGVFIPRDDGVVILGNGLSNDNH